ncbi:MAG: isoprenylcysteine carboxylmethyltransferase family protein [candidate division WOR-3 bacterium]|nr:MAG: isoprenylcysteine carboxylmethyltransferase family protein [candidate division WOR-3 bacterium]
MAKDRKNTEKDIAKKIKLEPPTYFLLYLLLGLVLHFVVPVKKLIIFPYTLIGVLLIVVGIWLNVWADSLFKRANTTVKPSEKSSTLVLEGPYRLSRHPMYLGMVIALLGVAIMLGSLVSFLGTIVCFITLQAIFIPHEERAMEETFGEAYTEYKKRVRSWI